MLAEHEADDRVGDVGRVDLAARAGLEHRDRAVDALYDFTCELARLADPSPEQLALFAAISRDSAASDDFVRVNAGTISPAAFFAPDNVARLMASA